MQAEKKRAGVGKVEYEDWSGERERELECEHIVNEV